jgi:hypothetical protein
MRAAIAGGQQGERENQKQDGESRELHILIIRSERAERKTVRNDEQG